MLRTWRASGLLILLFVSPLAAGALETQLAVNPRVEHIRSKSRALASRGYLGARGSLIQGDLSFTVDGFAETEREQHPSEERNAQDILVLQEAFVDYRFGAFFARLGRQPVRWSQSWTLPSLDLFTGRRWNRLFFDPVPDQLIHPDGALLTWVGANASLDIFVGLIPAPSQFPDPFPEMGDREYDPEGGLRFQRKFGGVDTTVIYKWADQLSTFGLALTYAFDNFVLKTENGVTENQDGFATAGVDVYLGDFSILPQITRFLDEIQTNDRAEHLAYLPVRYVWNKNTIDFQIYRNFEQSDLFAHAMYSRDMTDTFRISIFAQKYEGRPGRLFGAYQQMTDGGAVGGIRLEINQAL